jgi:hypothetical protein
MAITNGGSSKSRVIPIGTGAGTRFITRGGSGGKCAKKKAPKEAAFIGANDYRYAAEVKFLDSIVLEQAFKGRGGGTTFALFCDPSNEDGEE